MQQEASTRTLLLAYGVIYFIWGANFIAIRFAIDSVPPFMAAGLRFFIAGLLLFPIAFGRRERMPSLRQIGQAAQQGFWLNVCGTGALVWGEQYISSGLASILVSVVPIWMVVLDVPNWRANFSSWPLLVGLVLGVAGVVFLSGASIPTTDSSGFYLGLAALVFSAVTWAYGSLYSKRIAGQVSMFMALAVQMTSAGALLFVASAVTGEFTGFAFTNVTTESWLALAYMVAISSVLGYICYIWLLKVRPASEVGTYTFVHPLVAVVLGVVMADEVFNVRMLMAMCLILVAVFFIRYHAPIRAFRLFSFRP
ncbi:EamA-like transporter family protein [Catalinimonas alkaloidigena]|uniref:EamA-like transporter family protein n=1 Tax=Catalinimonas alkaloidigena TaxID=1075417 RepID=A0A1G9DJ13_9BACT|nr:EamA family transporter [Catalinimonas alkaloidigena]SDK63858.1 EamA-like transporter family protein [Catalinimonas alkaloidigena]